MERKLRDHDPAELRARARTAELLAAAAADPKMAPILERLKRAFLEAAATLEERQASAGEAGAGDRGAPRTTRSIMNAAAKEGLTAYTSEGCGCTAG
jgi:hypothetical protein